MLVLRRENISMFNAYVLILKSLAANLPILKAWGFSFPRVITVVAESGMMERIMRILVNFEDRDYQSKEDRNSDFVFYQFVNCSKNLEMIKKIRAKVSFDRLGAQGLPLLVTDNVLVDDDGFDQFFIFLEGHIELNTYKIGDIVPFPTELDLIKKKILSQEDAGLSEEERNLRAAVYFLESYCYRNDMLPFMDDLLKAAHQMCVVDEESRDMYDIDQSFIKVLYDWQSEENFGDIYELSETNDILRDWQNIMLYDENYLYMSEKLFKVIVEPLLQYVPINALKSTLADKGIVDTGSREKGKHRVNSYTVRMSAFLSDTDYRPRMMRLNRAKIERPGMLGFVDACYFAKEEGEDEDV